MKNRGNIAVWQLFLLLLLMPLMITSVQAAGNLLTNPGFEEGTAGWDNRGTCTLSISAVHRSGSYSGYATNRSYFWQGIKQSLLGKMQPGETYTISGWVRLENSSSDQVAVTIERNDDRGVHYISVDGSTGYNNQWTQLSGQFTLDVVGTLTTLDVYFEGPAAGVNFYLDDAEVLGDGVEPPDSNATGMVDIGIVYQELEGFGASGAWYENWLTAHPLKSEIYDVLFGQLGLDIYRLRNTYDISSGYISRSAEIVQAAQSSLGHPIKIMISSWSPPAYLKSNNNTVGGTLKKDTYGNYMYDEFAEWWGDSLDEFSGYGIDADYVNIQNEPDWLADWDTCKFIPTETEDWAGYNLAFEAVYQELWSRLSELPKLLAPEACGCGNSQAYIDALINTDHVYGYAHHLYADGDYDYPDSFIPAMANFVAQYGDKPLLQTEYSRGQAEEAFTVALNLAKHIHNSLVHESACSFFYWDLFWGEEGGLVTLDNPWGANPGYTINHTYYTFKQYSAFTDPGWYRVEASTDSNALRISAFKNADNTGLSIAIINVSDACINLALSLENFSPDTSSVYRTSESENTAYIGTFDELQSLVLPPQTITTVSLTGSYSPDFSNCAEVQTAGYSLASDISGDCYVNYIDLGILTDYWLATNCGDLNNCDGADFEPDGDVDFADLSMFILQWLQCNDPQDPACTPNW